MWFRQKKKWLTKVEKTEADFSSDHCCFFKCAGIQERSCSSYKASGWTPALPPHQFISIKRWRWSNVELIVIYWWHSKQHTACHLTTFSSICCVYCAKLQNWHRLKGKCAVKLAQILLYFKTFRQNCAHMKHCPCGYNVLTKPYIYVFSCIFISFVKVQSSKFTNKRM